MRKFYLFQKGQVVPAQLTWSCYIELLKIDDFNIINYYINITLKYILSTRELRNKIKNNEYERLDEETKNKIIKTKNKNHHIQDFIKHPILIKNTINYQEISKKT